MLEDMMHSILILASVSAEASGFGGADVALSMEMDPNGAAYLLDLDVELIRSEQEKDRYVWAPFKVSLILGEESPVANVDHLRAAVIDGEHLFESNLVRATYRAGEIHFDSEAAFIDFTAARGSVSFPVWGDLIRTEIGIDFRARFLMPEEQENTMHLSLGVPVSFLGTTASDRPQFAQAEVGIRPGVRLVGNEAMLLSSFAKATLGYAFVQAEDVELKSGLSYGFFYDNATVFPVYWSHLFSAQFSAIF